VKHNLDQVLCGGFLMFGTVSNVPHRPEYGCDRIQLLKTVFLGNFNFNKNLPPGKVSLSSQVPRGARGDECGYL